MRCSDLVLWRVATKEQRPLTCVQLLAPTLRCVQKHRWACLYSPREFQYDCVEVVCRFASSRPVSLWQQCKLRVVVTGTCATRLHCWERLTRSVHAYHCAVSSLPLVNALLFASHSLQLWDESNIPVLNWGCGFNSLLCVSVRRC